MKTVKHLPFLGLLLRTFSLEMRLPLKTNFWIKVAVSAENTDYAERCHKLEQERNLGVALTAYARCKEGVCWAVMMPRTKRMLSIQ